MNNVTISKTLKITLLSAAVLAITNLMGQTENPPENMRVRKITCFDKKGNIVGRGNDCPSGNTRCVANACPVETDSEVPED